MWRKQEVLRWIDTKGYKLDGGTVRKWWRDRENILTADPASDRLVHVGGGRRSAIRWLIRLQLQVLLTATRMTFKYREADQRLTIEYR
ncbi:Glucose-1-phosphate adenylyltransferase [Phytophthora palmivora]|uniref:Glucose-1-phosphate adenylyltransferase n=1 Tax=Phytophthora palmivora TaxID=4796 RepID=A0A2P4YV15_9STRA|nr:Glucose-1-phosphate adenylyltransferase [Phytophthora palmivora]